MKLKTRYLLSFFMIISSLYACQNDNNTTEYFEDKSEEILIDTVETITPIIDEEEEIPTINTSEIKNEEVRKNTERIEKTYGKQWEFCECIIKMDSVNTALMNANDEEFDIVMERSDYIDSKCKHILIQANGTPEERIQYQNRVKKCLQEKK